MLIKKYVYLIKELVTYLEVNNYEFNLTLKPVIYNFTLQTYTDNINEEIYSMFVLYKGVPLAYKKNIKQVIQLLPEEQFYLYNIIDNNKYVFKITHNLLLNKLNNNIVDYSEDIFKNTFITTEDAFYDIMLKIINFDDDNENEQKEIETILHTRFLMQFLSENIRKLLTVNEQLLINLLHIVSGLKVKNHKLYIDLDCCNIHNTNNIISILTSFNIVSYNKSCLSIKQGLNNIISKFDNYVENLQYNINKKSTINISFVMKDSYILDWLILFYLINNIQYI